MSSAKRGQKRHLGLLRLFITVLFSSGLLNSAITSLAVYILVRTGVLQVAQVADFSIGRLTVFFMLLSVPISFLVAALGGKFALRPVRDLIGSMNELASGNFRTRIQVGRFMRRYPAFVEIADSFNRMAQELEQTEMLRSDFVNNFSHEFKTPIVSIAGFAQLLCHGELPREQQREYLAVIEEESRRLSTMATNVMELTRIENQSILTDVTTYNLSEQLRSCILLLERKWSEKELELLLHFGEHTIRANEELLRQVWINLLDNAVKFTPPRGSIRVTITQTDACIEVQLHNTGSHIPDACIEQIFRKFYQADRSHATQGNGIGLAIVREVVSLHGGAVCAANREDGVSFTVTLPQ